MWGNRVVVPGKLRAQITEELHRNHPGITRIMSLHKAMCGGLGWTQQ